MPYKYDVYFKVLTYAEANLMTVKMRKQIYIEPHQDAILKRLAKRTGASEAEIIRQAIDRHVQSLQIPGSEMAAWEEEEAFIETLMQLGPVTGGRTWKRENIYDR